MKYIKNYQEISERKNMISMIGLRILRDINGVICNFQWAN